MHDTAKLVATLGLVQSKLSHLEAENSISRRRVRELEMELEACKREVAKERTRVIEREQLANARQKAEVRAQKEREREREREREVCSSGEG